MLRLIKYNAQYTVCQEKKSKKFKKFLNPNVKAQISNQIQSPKLKFQNF